jgi:hypothetical protein
MADLSSAGVASVGLSFIKQLGQRHADITLGAERQVIDRQIDDLGVMTTGTDNFRRFLLGTIRTVHNSGPDGFGSETNLSRDYVLPVLAG